MPNELITVTLNPQENAEQRMLDTFERLVQATPRDQNNFLTYFLDHSYIPSDIDARPDTQKSQLIQTAKLPLSMIEGYLSFNQVKPVWDQLPHEPDSYYEAFRFFLNSPERDISQLQHAFPSLSPLQLKSLYTFYYWRERSKACDLLRPVAAARLRDQRILQTEDAQFRIATQLASFLSKEIEHRTEETEGRPFAGMHGKDLIDSLIKAMGMQRVALRLPTGGTKSDGIQDPDFASPEQRISQAARQYDGKKPDQSAAQQLKEQVQKLIAQNEGDAHAVQELIISTLMKTRTPQPAESAPHAPVPDTEASKSDEKEEGGQ